MDNRLRTGIEHFDREIGGGLSPGSIIGLVTPPESQGEQLLRAIARTNRAAYISTTRPAGAVREWLATGEPEESTSQSTVLYAGIDRFRPHGRDALREWFGIAGPENTADQRDQFHARTATQLHEISTMITAERAELAIIDPLNPLESVDESMYTAFFHQIQRHLVETGAILLLHMVETPTPPDCRWVSLQMADEVWKMAVELLNERVEFRLTVTKSRSGDVPSRQIKFHLSDDITIDTSRDIA